MPYWINSTLAATPALLWMFLGLGLPWALLFLPRRDWRDPGVVGTLTLAFGPALLTAWMFILGTIGGAQNSALITRDLTLLGTAVIAALGWLLVWRKFSRPSATTHHSPATNHLPLTADSQPPATRFDERLLILLIGIALIVRWVGVAYWPSTAYDARWVYAYQGQLYALKGFIPPDIGYYPPFLALQHAWLHLAVGGVDDHAARAVLPWLHLGSILAAYTLGRLLFTRRVGIYLAAIWALYPHMGEWSRYGDLEVPLTFLFTAAAAFFLKAISDQLPGSRPAQGSTQHSALRTESSTIRYALIAGLLLGIGLWTKPTMGAFIWGVMLLVGLRLIWQLVSHLPFLAPLTNNLRTQDSVRSAVSRLAVIRHVLLVPFFTALACIPLGAAWYLRNILLGHNAVDFPPGIWLERAARSGAEFGWPLLALLVGVAFMLSGAASAKSRPAYRWLLSGTGLVLLATLPTILQPGRMGLVEWSALLIGIGLITWAIWKWLPTTGTETRRMVTLIGAAGLLALPYFVTWFYSYSYHYRLSFAIVPLLILPTAVLLARWTENRTITETQTLHKGPGLRSVLIGIVITLLAVPGIINPLYDPNAGWDWLWTDKLPDDHARHRSGNQALMAVVDGLQIYLDTHDPQTEPLRVVAPGALQLPFFFPLENIDTNPTPTHISDLEGVTYFIYGVPESGGDFSTFTMGVNPVLDLLGRAVEGEDDQRTPLRRAWWADDGIFQFNVYELHLERRFTPPKDYAAVEGEITFGGMVRLLGYDLVGLELWQGRPLWMHLYWQVLERPDRDYFVYVHLRDRAGNLVQAWDGPVSWRDDGFQWDAPNYYSSLIWEPGEYIVDRRIPRLQEPIPPFAEDYQIVVGLYDPQTNERLPLLVDGQVVGDGWAIPHPFVVKAEPQ